MTVSDEYLSWQLLAFAEVMCTGTNNKRPEYIRLGKLLGGLYKANNIKPETTHHEKLAQGAQYVRASTAAALNAGIPREQIRAAFALAFGKAPHL